MNLPEPFGGAPIGRIKTTGVLVTLNTHEGQALRARPVVSGPGGKMVPTGDSMIVQKADVEPLTKSARDVIKAQVEVKVKETMEVKGDAKGHIRTRTSGGELA